MKMYSNVCNKYKKSNLKTLKCNKKTLGISKEKNQFKY